MITFKEFKNACKKTTGNLFFLKDEVSCYYADKKNQIVVLDISDGWYDDWVHETAREIANNLCDGHNDVSCAEDDWNVVIDCCEFMEINVMTIENGNLICS